MSRGSVPSSARRRKRRDKYLGWQAKTQVWPCEAPEYQEDDSGPERPDAWANRRIAVTGFSRHARVRLEERYGVEPERSHQVARDILAQLRNRTAVWMSASIACSHRDALAVCIQQSIAVVVATRELPVRVVTVLPPESIKEFALSAKQLIAIEEMVAARCSREGLPASQQVPSEADARLREQARG